MAQISIIQYSDIKEAQRIDAEYFKPEYLSKIANLNKINSDELVNKATITDGEHGSPDLDPSSEIYYLSGHNIKDNVLDLNDIRYCTKQLHNKNKRSRIKKYNVLLSIVVTVGNATVIYKDFVGNTDRNVATIKDINLSLNHYYLSTFLNSQYGKFQTTRFQTGNVQPLLNLSQVRKIKIPILPKEFQLKIEQIVKTAHQKQKQSEQLYKEAKELLLEELGLLNYHPKHKLSFETTKKEVEEATRFDSEYFQPKYKEIISKVKNYSGGFDFVKNILRFNKTNFFPKENELYNYIPLSRVSNNGEIEIPEKELGKDLPTRARRKVKTGEIILSSISGSLETSAMIREEHEGFIVSNGFYVFNSDKINSETLLMLFKSKIMIELLQRISKGAILGGYDLTAFEKIKIPLIKQTVQKQIADKVQESHKLRKESKDLLEEAKRKVEEEIEKAGN